MIPGTMLRDYLARQERLRLENPAYRQRRAEEEERQELSAPIISHKDREQHRPLTAEECAFRGLLSLMTRHLFTGLPLVDQTSIVRDHDVNALAALIWRAYVAIKTKGWPDFSLSWWQARMQWQARAAASVREPEPRPGLFVKPSTSMLAVLEAAAGPNPDITDEVSDAFVCEYYTWGMDVITFLPVNDGPNPYGTGVSEG
jgi:hypothetical protein